MPCDNARNLAFAALALRTHLEHSPPRAPLDTYTLSFLAQAAKTLTTTTPPDKVIQRHGAPYLERWHLDRAIGYDDHARLYLHRIVADDDDDPHDHPWPSVSLALQGTLTEHWWPNAEALLNGAMRVAHIRPGTLCVRANVHIHRLSLPPSSSEALTLFVTGTRTRTWGFWRTDKILPAFVPWRDYIAERDQVHFVNEYEINRTYGGPEEGGWWYETGRFIKEHARHTSSQHATQTRDALTDEIETRRIDRYPPNHVACDGWPEIRIETHPGRDFPETAPHYE